MVLALVVLVALLLLAAVYVARALWDPFTTRGRRRVLWWARGWWHGEQAENRDDY